MNQRKYIIYNIKVMIQEFHYIHPVPKNLYIITYIYDMVCIVYIVYCKDILDHRKIHIFRRNF